VWNTWHANAGCASQAANVTCFIDCVPASFLDANLRTWYKHVAAHAPCDPGAGSGRGSWLMFAHLAKSGADRFGLDSSLMKTWEMPRPVKRDKDVPAGSEIRDSLKARGFVMHAGISCELSALRRPPCIFHTQHCRSTTVNTFHIQHCHSTTVNISHLTLPADDAPSVIAMLLF
jgi:hypothetical protein